MKTKLFSWYSRGNQRANELLTSGVKTIINFQPLPHLKICIMWNNPKLVNQLHNSTGCLPHQFNLLKL